MRLKILYVFLFLFLFSGKFLTQIDDKAAAAQPADGVVELTESLVDTLGRHVEYEEEKALNQKEDLTEELIEERKEELERIRKEAEKLKSSKAILESEAALKEEAVLVARKELEVLKKEAEITREPQTRQQVRELQREIRHLQDQAAVSKSRLELAQAQTHMAEKWLSTSEDVIERLKEELRELRLERAAGRSWTEKALRAGGILGVSLLLIFFLTLLKKLEDFVTDKNVIRESETSLRVKTFIKLFHWLGVMIIILVMIYYQLRNFGIDITPLLAGAGIVGLALGFGGQYMIRDIINGVFIISEGQYRIHDVVKINEYGGLVEDVNLRITVLRDLEGRVITIPNGKVETVVNFTKDYAHALIELGVGYKEDLDRVMDTIRDMGEELRRDAYFGRLILDDLEMLGVDDFAESRILIKFRVKTLPIKQWEVAREFRRRIKKRFDDLGIDMPLPRRVLSWEESWEHKASKIPDLKSGFSR